MSKPRVVTALSQDSRGLFLDFDDGSREFYRVRITHEHPDNVAIPLGEPQVREVAVVEEQLDDNCARVRWIFNPVPVGEKLLWDHGRAP